MSSFRDFTLFQKILFILAILIFVIPIIVIICIWPQIPDQIPTHFNAAGIADAWNGKSSIVVLIVVEFFTFILMAASTMFPKLWNMPVKVTENNAYFVYRYCRTLLCFMTLIINLMFSYMNIQSLRSASLGVWFLPVTMAAIFLPLILFIIKCVRLPK